MGLEAAMSRFGLRALISSALPNEPAKSTAKLYLENRLYKLLRYQQYRY